MKKLPLVLFTLIIAGCSSTTSYIQHSADNWAIKLIPPPGGKIYHAAFPDFGADEDNISIERLNNFETLANKKITWAYFSNNWFNGEIKFPKEKIDIIHQHGSIPFIRLMPRSNLGLNSPDSRYTLQQIIDGKYDTQLTQWMKAAKATGIPLLAEFGTECNGQWFWWNAKYNGGNNKNGYSDSSLYDGMERFKDAYRHIIELARVNGALNITWFFHINCPGDPAADWNTMNGYYPGDDYIDWIGLSVYGPQTQGETWKSFSDILSSSWEDILKISAAGKPIAVLEWGANEDAINGKKAGWVKEAFKSITNGGKFYPHIKAVSCWHSAFDKTNLRIDSSPSALEAYKEGISDSCFICKPYFTE